MLIIIIFIVFFQNNDQYTQKSPTLRANVVQILLHESQTYIQFNLQPFPYKIMLQNSEETHSSASLKLISASNHMGLLVLAPLADLQI